MTQYLKRIVPAALHGASPLRPSSARLVLEGIAPAGLHPIDLTLAAGECVAIMGPSGAGKSLLLRQVADLDPGVGQAWLDGRPRSGMPGPAWRRQVVYCQAEAGWWDDRVAPHFPAPGSPRMVDALALMERLNLPARLLGCQVHELSTGERQRMGLVRALLNEPAVLLLDEPTAALDEDATARVEAELQARLVSGTSALIVTHAVAQARRLAHRTFHIVDGRLEEAIEGPPLDMARNGPTQTGARELP
jgi:ABC-type iron transport system FetAB ATPase subunit